VSPRCRGRACSPATSGNSRCSSSSSISMAQRDPRAGSRSSLRRGGRQHQRERSSMKRNEEILYLESDPKIFEDRFARCRRLLHFLAARILGSQDEAEDAVRNCRAAASRNPPSFESEGAFRSWLARIFIDEACALLRRKQFSLMRSPQESSYQPGR